MRGGGIISSIGGIFYFIIKCIFFLVVGICVLMLFGVVSIVAMVLVGAYKFANELLFGTNVVINGLNSIIKPIAKAMFVFINGIIDGINEMIKGLNAAGDFFTTIVPDAVSKVGEEFSKIGDEVASWFGG